MEGVLVRHPPSSLTKRRGERGPGGTAAWSLSLDVATRGGSGQRRRARDRGRQRSRHELGSRPKKPRPGGAARRSYRSQLHQDRAAPLPHTSAGASAPHARRDGSWTMAEAGGSPSSDAPPGSGSLEVQRPKAGRRRPPRASEGAKAPEGVSRRGESPGGWSRKGLPRCPARESPSKGPQGLRQGEQVRSGIGWSVLGARGRKSVAEVGEKHLSPRTLGVPRGAHALRGETGKHGDSLKRPVGL